MIRLQPALGLLSAPRGNSPKDAEHPSHPRLTKQHQHLAPAAREMQISGLKGSTTLYKCLNGSCSGVWVWSRMGTVQQGWKAERGRGAGMGALSTSVAPRCMHSLWGEAYGETSPRESRSHPSPCRPQPQLLAVSLSLLSTGSTSTYCLIIAWYECVS